MCSPCSVRKRAVTYTANSNLVHRREPADERVTATPGALVRCRHDDRTALPPHRRGDPPPHRVGRAGPGRSGPLHPRDHAGVGRRDGHRHEGPRGTEPGRTGTGGARCRHGGRGERPGTRHDARPPAEPGAHRPHGDRAGGRGGPRRAVDAAHRDGVRHVHHGALPPCPEQGRARPADGRSGVRQRPDGAPPGGVAPPSGTGGALAVEAVRPSPLAGTLHGRPHPPDGLPERDALHGTGPGSPGRPRPHPGTDAARPPHDPRLRPGHRDGRRAGVPGPAGQRHDGGGVDDVDGVPHGRDPGDRGLPGPVHVLRNGRLRTGAGHPLRARPGAGAGRGGGDGGGGAGSIRLNPTGCPAGRTPSVALDTTARVRDEMRGLGHAQRRLRNRPVVGLYETLITHRLEERMKQLNGTGWRPIEGPVSSELAPHVLSRHIGDTVRQILQGLSLTEQVLAANHILESIKTLEGATQWIDLVTDGPPRQLLSVAEQEAAGVYAIRPATPLSDTALITNSPDDPSLGFELRAELATADRVDLLCAFVKWHGLRVLEEPLASAHARGVPIRVLTTTYIGA